MPSKSTPSVSPELERLLFQQNNSCTCGAGTVLREEKRILHERVAQLEERKAGFLHAEEEVEAEILRLKSETAKRAREHRDRVADATTLHKDREKLLLRISAFQAIIDDARRTTTRHLQGRSVSSGGAGDEEDVGQDGTSRKVDNINIHTAQQEQAIRDLEYQLEEKKALIFERKREIREEESRWKEELETRRAAVATLEEKYGAKKALLERRKVAERELQKLREEEEELEGWEQEIAGKDEGETTSEGSKGETARRTTVSPRAPGNENDAGRAAACTTTQNVVGEQDQDTGGELQTQTVQEQSSTSSTVAATEAARAATSTHQHDQLETTLRQELAQIRAIEDQASSLEAERLRLEKEIQAAQRARREKERELQLLADAERVQGGKKRFLEFWKRLLQDVEGLHQRTDEGASGGDAIQSRIDAYNDTDYDFPPTTSSSSNGEDATKMSFVFTRKQGVAATRRGHFGADTSSTEAHNNIMEDVDHDEINDASALQEPEVEDFLTLEDYVERTRSCQDHDLRFPWLEHAGSLGTSAPGDRHWHRASETLDDATTEGSHDHRVPRTPRNDDEAFTTAPAAQMNRTSTTLWQVRLVPREKEQEDLDLLALKAAEREWQEKCRVLQLELDELQRRF
ncbi:unnamed protein product [Amoebophrya sp. A120]|nr:unnamed protein product [Amoebophrya sp. A120]|eukprot:GSA120T00000596001.1